MEWRNDATATEVQLTMQVGKAVQNVWCRGKSRDLIDYPDGWEHN